MDATCPDNANVVRSFKNFVAGMRVYLTVNLGWSAAEAADYLREPDQFKADWIDGLTPAEAVDNDLYYPETNHADD